MSTIASPRDSPAPHNRRMNSSQAIITPTSSTRPSLDLPRSATGSPNPSNQAGAPSSSSSTAKRANRAALREYYKLQKSTSTPGSMTPSLELPDSNLDDAFQAQHPNIDPSSLMPPSELDAPTFSAPSYVAQTLSSQTLSELLRTYTRILGEIRALDAEKKALVYDNYSKLISATETIRRMRSTMDPLNPVAGTLDLVVAKIYETAVGLREEVRRGVVDRPAVTKGEEEGGLGGKEQEELERRRRAKTRELAKQVVEVPARLRRLVDEGKEEEARREWEMPRRLLERWRERGLGGDEVGGLIEEGDSIVGLGAGAPGEGEGR